MMRRLPPIVIAASLALVLSGCSATGPMRVGSGADTDTSTVCIPQPDDPVIGGEVFQITGEQSAVIDEVSIVGGTNVELVDAYVIPIIDGEGGVGAGYLPLSDLPGWDRAVTAAGATIEPGGDTSVALVMERLDSTEEGFADRIQIEYTVAGRTYHKQNSTRFELKDRCF